VETQRTFISSLRLLAELAREPVSRDPNVAVGRFYSLREMINRSFDQVRALTDALLFEFGRSRHEDLALRSRILRWQPQLRMLLLARLALWRYRVGIPGFELPAPVATAQREFDKGLAAVVDRMADRLEGKVSEGNNDFEDAFENLEKQVLSCCSTGPQGLPAAELQSFLALSSSIENVTLSLNNEI
jgi:multidrug resistance protein MdtO